MTGTLFIVATPVGNMDDITLRALATLRHVDTIACEDTRVTHKLLARHGISVPLVSYHQHSTAAHAARILALLAAGKDVALVSDAGTPGISDPGGMLVERVVKELGASARIVPIPGASAAVSALSVSGFPADRFLFLGFPPHKKGRTVFFKTVAATEETVVFYESKHRIEKTLTALAAAVGERSVMVARELTKQFESFYRGTAAECCAALRADDTRGEFVVVVRAR
ncbi:MAG: 16S rRNA (cytidine(1402)-2'-O)-methyltransferase [Patescibacteria group bacterium]